MANSTTQSFDTPSIQASQAGLVFHSTTRIAAPASLVFRSLRNTETWKDWNRFVPRVNITFQPPDEDLATVAEIHELVRNTSIAGSYDSDLTEGMAGSGVAKQRLSENGERPETPPLRLRMNSQASRGSQRSDSEARSDSESGVPAAPATNGLSPLAANSASTEPKLSGAQLYAAAQASRKASVASGGSPEPVNNTLKSAPAEGPLLVAYVPSTNPSPSRRASLAPTDGEAHGRRMSKSTSLAQKAAQKAKQQTLNMLYGEPPVRLQLNTKMTFFIRMNPNNPREFKQTHFVVTEVSRPDDPLTDGPNLTALTRTKTHTLNRVNVYRIVWAMDNSLSSMSNMKNGSAFPKSLLQTERVHEIRPIVLGDGSEECEYKTWELQKGPLSKVVKKKYEGYLQAQFEIWGKGLGEFCEAMVGRVDRRDFSVSIEGEPTTVGVITF